MKKLFIFFVLFSLICCSKEVKQTKLIFTFENSKLEVGNFKICENKYGFQISVEKSIQQKIVTQKIKSFFVANGIDKIEIKTFNLLLSPPENFPHKAPTTPKGNLAFFKDGNNLIIDVLSNNKTAIVNLVGIEYVLKCASH